MAPYYLLVDHLWDGLAGALIGGIIAAIGSFVSIKAQLKSERNLRKREQDSQVKALLSALYHELDSVWTVYMTGAGATMDKLPDKSPFMEVTPSAGEYFNVYNGNVTSLGLIPDFALREKIITTYTLGRSLMDAYMLNNQLVNDFKISQGQRYPTSSPVHAILSSQGERENLARFGSLLKAAHLDCKMAIGNLLPRLRQAIDE